MEDRPSNHNQTDLQETSEDDNLTFDKAMASKSKTQTKTGARHKSTSRTRSQVTRTSLRQEETSRSENTHATGITSSTAPKKKRRKQTDVKTCASKKTNPDKSKTQAKSSAIGQFTSDTTGNVPEFTFTPRQISQVLDINVKSPTDKAGEPSVTGLALLPDNKLILAEHTNLTVKLVNIKQNRIITELKLPSEPYDITVVSDNHVAMTMPADNQIQMMSISNNEIFLGQIIKVKGICYGIVHNEGTLLVTFIKPVKVEMISMSGSVLRVIDKGTNGEPLFAWPEYIALSPDNTHVYISDRSKDTVTCMTLDGEVKGVYRDASLQCPHGLAVDKTGSVYVVAGAYMYPDMYQISADCSQGQKLLGYGHGIFYPISIIYCHKEDKLYMGQLSHSIKVLQLK